MPVLMSKSAALDVARALRKADGPGLIEVGVRSGSLYVDLVDAGARTGLYEAKPPLLADVEPSDTLGR